MNRQDRPAICTHESGVAGPKFNRLEFFEARGRSMAQVRADACRRLQSGSGLREVLPSGEGWVFPAGENLARMRRDRAPAAGRLLDAARFDVACAGIGTRCGGSSARSLPRTGGPRMGMEIASLSENLDTAEAHSIGRMHRVVPVSQTETVVARAAAGAPLEPGHPKRRMRGTVSRGLPSQRPGRAGSTEGVAAFCARHPARCRRR